MPRLHLAAITLALGLASHARAEAPPRPALHWTRGPGAEECIDPRTLAERVSALTGPVLVDAARADLSIEGQVTRGRAGRYEVRVSATGRSGVPAGTRSLAQDGGDCRALDTSIAFVIAVMIDPDLTLSELPASLVALGAEGPRPEAQLLTELASDPPAAAGPTVPEPPPVARVPKTPELPATEPRHLELAAGVHGSTLVLPRAALGAALAVTYAPWRQLAVELSFTGSRMVGRHFADAHRAVSAATLGGALRVGARKAWRRRALGAYVGPDVAWVRVRGSGFSEDAAATLASYGASGVLDLGIAVAPWLWLHMRGGVRVALNRSRFSYTREAADPQEVFRVGRVSQLFEIAMGAAF